MGSSPFATSGSSARGRQLKAPRGTSSRPFRSSPFASRRRSTTDARAMVGMQQLEKFMKSRSVGLIAVGGAVVLAALYVPAIAPRSLAQTGPANSATEATRAANARVLQELPFADKKDFEVAHRGFIARPKSLIIKHAKGNAVWDM